MRLRPLLFLALALAPAAAHAQTTEMESARAQAMGGAFRALCFDNSAVDLNPAGLAQFKKVEIEPGYFRSSDGREYAMGFSLADSLTNVTGTGMAYEYRKVKPDATGAGGLESQRYALAVGFPVVPDQAWLGMSTKYFKFDYVDPTVRDKKGWTADIGLLYRPMNWLATGATFDNLINGNQAEAPRGLTGGVAVLPAEWVAASADVFTDLASTNQDKTGWALGAQLSPTRQVALRGGLYREAVSGKQFWTGGIGLISENGTIDYSARMPDGGSSKALSHFVTVSLLVF